MDVKTVEFCGELQGETTKCWFVYDGESTVSIPKSQVKELRMLPNNVDCIMHIPQWLALEKGILP